MAIVNETISTLSMIADKIYSYKKRASASLTSFTKDANIIGRVYIEDSIARDDIAIPLMGTLNQMYVSYILTALHLDAVVISGHTVREVIGMVASEGYADAATFIMNHFGKENLDKPMISLEDQAAKVEDQEQRLICGRLIELDMFGQTTVTSVDETDGTTNTNGGRLAGHTRTDEYSIGPDKDTNTDSTKQTGYKITKSDHNNPETSTSASFKKETVTKTQRGVQSFKVYIYVQLIPYILDSVSAGDFFSFNFVPGFLRRWKQVRAGEIKFIRDFIFARDLIERQKSAIKKDKTGVLVDMMLRQKNALFRWAMQAIGIRPENHNSASSMFVISKQSFDAACAAQRIDFKSNSVRQSFFNKTFTMLILVVDPMYGTMEMYINGVNVIGKYTFDMINKVGAKGKDSFDLKQIMQSLNQGMTPKF